MRFIFWGLGHLLYVSADLAHPASCFLAYLVVKDGWGSDTPIPLAALGTLFYGVFGGGP